MVIARKLLVPLIILFALLLTGALVFLGISNVRSLQAEEQRYLLGQRQAFQDELARFADLTLAISKHVASDPEILQAFAQGDRQRLLDLNRDSFRALQGNFRVHQQRFTQAPATVVLDLSDVASYGQDLSDTRLSLLAANTRLLDVAALELAPDGLAMRGIAPFEVTRRDGSRLRGSVETSLRLDQRVFNDLRAKYGGDWQLLLLRPVLERSGFKLVQPPRNEPLPDLILTASTLEKPVYNRVEAYQRLLAGQAPYILDRLSQGNKTYAILTLPLRDFSGQVVGTVDIVWDRSQAQILLLINLLTIALGGLVGLLFIGFILYVITNQTLQPLLELNTAAQAIARGDLHYPLPSLVPSPRKMDEVEQLNRSFHIMTTQLRELVGNLEGQVAERTKMLEQRSNQMQAAAEIAAQVARQGRVDELLNLSVNLIRQRFNYYHAGVFLTDESGQYAVLRAATGEAGRRMLEASHRLRVGQVGLVGAAVGSGQPQVSPDVEHDPLHFKNPYLPETRSEAVLPLRVGDQVIGALDVQSQQPNAFDPSTLSTLQIMADQLAIALNNAKLIEELNRTVNELQETQRRITRESWQMLLRRSQHILGYRYMTTESEGSSLGSGSMLSPLEPQEAPPEVWQAMEQNRPLWQTNGDSQAHTSLTVPIRLRGEAIGALHLRFQSPVPQEETQTLLEDIASRLALAMESARLLEDAQRMAAREQVIAQVTSQLRASLDLQAVLRAAVQEIAQRLDLSQVEIQLATPDGDGQASQLPRREQDGMA